MAGQGFARFGLTLILPDMQAGLGLRLTDLGLIAGVAFGAYLLSAAPAGAAAARFGARRVISAALLASAAALALTGLAPDLRFVLAAQALSGVAGAFIITPVLGLSPAWVARRHWARATGAIVAGGGIGLAASGLLVPAALRIGGGDGWRLAWFCLAAAVLLLAVLAVLLLRDAPPPVESAAGRPGLRAVMRSPAVWWIGLAFLCFGTAFAIYGTFFGAQLVSQRGLAVEAAGRLWTAGGLASVGSGLIGGWLADRFGRRGPLCLLFLGEGLGLAMLAVGPTEGWYLLAAILYGLTVWGFPAIFTAASADAVGPALAPAAVGLTVLCFSIGQALGPPVAGLLAEQSGSISSALLMGVGADLLGVLVALTGVTRPAGGGRADFPWRP